MRLLFTVNPGVGHFHQMAPVARALEQAGHEVAFACANSFRRAVEFAGFSSFPAGLDWLESEAEHTFPELASLSAEQQSSYWLTHVFANAAARHIVPDLLSICNAWKPDVVVRGEFEFGGCVAAEFMEIPHATISLGIFLPVHILRPLIGKQVNDLRTAYGLPSDPDLQMLYRYLYLAFSPLSYQFPNMSLPSVFHSLRQDRFDRSGNEGLPSWVNDLPKRPTVHVTLGTIFNRATDIYQTIVEALRDEPINLILTVGRDRHPSQFGSQPSNVHIERYIPHSLLLDYCAVVITHGGACTTLSALSKGLPLLLIPLSADQPFHAMRCASLGVALVIKQHGQFDAYLHDRYYGELSAEAIRNAVRELLQNPAYRQSAQRIREEMMSLPGPERAVELITKLASGKNSARQ
jgi:UDP:flavonoid glycosyltransferase YjiC (YdhE family)